MATFNIPVYPVILPKPSKANVTENYCKLESIMSTCTAPDPEKCKYYEKARFVNRCMWLLFDEYCSCLKAQEEVKP